MVLVLTLKSGNVLVVSHDENDGTMQEHRKQIEKDFAGRERGFQVKVSDCGQVGEPTERFSSICNCPFDCNGGVVLDIDEIIFVDEENFSRLSHLGEEHYAGGSSWRSKVIE